MTLGPAWLLLASAGCTKISTITLDEEASTVVERGTLIEEFISDFGFGDFLNMDLTQSAALRNQGVEPGDIEDVRLEHLELEATDPSGADMAFLESMDLFVEAPGVARAPLASSPGFPEGQALVVFDLAEVDLTPYVVSESMTFDTEVTGRRPDVNTTLTARFTVAFRVTTQGLRNAASRDE